MKRSSTAPASVSASNSNSNSKNNNNDSGNKTSINANTNSNSNSSKNNVNININTSASASSGASGEAPAAPEAEPVTPLSVATLGNAEVVKRAETVVSHLREVVSDTNNNTKSDNTQELPSKIEITKAMAEIDKLVAKTKSEVTEAKEETTKARKEEEARRIEKANQLEEEEKKRKLELKQRKEDRRKEEEHSKILAEQEAEEQSEIRYQAELKKRKAALEDELAKCREERKTIGDQEREAKAKEVGGTMNEIITKARSEKDKSAAIQNAIKKKLAKAEKQHKVNTEIEKKKKQKQKKKKTISKETIPLEDIVNSITMENKRRAKEAQTLAHSIANPHFGLGTDFAASTAHEMRDPKYQKTFEEWTIMACQVEGLANPLYTKPSEAPYYQHNEETHALVGPMVKEYVRDKQKRLRKHWLTLAEEYEVRKRLYEKQQKRKLAKKSQRVSVTSRKSIMGGKKEKETPGSDKGASSKPIESGARSSNNPYRRARRGNEVRSEYEQEQIIAEIAAREAMEKRITHGGSKLPRQVCPLERELTAIYVNTFTSHRVDDPMREAKEENLSNVWTDMEKCIFLDRFLQFPKDFRRIASFLKNKTTKDCIAFYYDSKQTVPYKGALKEHMMRRKRKEKRKGDYQVWDASIQAAVSVGAQIAAGENEDKPINFSVPRSDLTYHTRMLHPLQREVLDSMVIDESIAAEQEDKDRSEDARWKSRKRGRDPLFLVDKRHLKFLRQASQDSMAIQRVKTKEESKTELVREESEEIGSDANASVPIRKAPEKWTAAEKEIFMATLEEHGRNWAVLSKAVGTKTESQIKNFYYDFKKKSGKSCGKSDKKGAGNRVESSAPKTKTTESTRKKEKLQQLDETAADRGRSAPAPSPPPQPLSSSQVTQQISTSSAQPMGAPALTASSARTPVPEDRSMVEQEVLQHQHTQAILGNLLSERGRARVQKSMLRETEAPPLSRNGPSPVPRSNIERLSNNVSNVSHELLHRFQQQTIQQQTIQQQKKQRFELQLLQHQEQQLHRQQQRQQQHTPQSAFNQSALHQILSRHHHQREQQQHHSSQHTHEDARRILEQQSQQQPMSNLFSSWSPASQLLQQAHAQNRMHHAQFSSAFHQEGGGAGSHENGAKPDSPQDIDIASLQRLLHMQQLQKNPMLALGQSNHGSQLSSLMGLGSSAGSGISPALLAQLEGLTSASRNQPQADVLLNALSYATSGSSNGGGVAGNPMFHHGNGGGGNPSPSDGSHSPHPAETIALLQRMQRESGGSQHGFGGPNHQG